MIDPFDNNLALKIIMIDPLIKIATSCHAAFSGGSVPVYLHSNGIATISF